MQRGLHYRRIHPGTEALFDQRHRDISPELIEESRPSGIHGLTGFRRGTDVWYYGEYERDVRRALAIRDEMPAHRRWRHDLRDVIAEMATDAGEPILPSAITGPRGPRPGVQPATPLVEDPLCGPGASNASRAHIPHLLGEELVAAPRLVGLIRPEHRVREPFLVR